MGIQTTIFDRIKSEEEKERAMSVEEINNLRQRIQVILEGPASAFCMDDEQERQDLEDLLIDMLIHWAQGDE